MHKTVLESLRGPTDEPDATAFDRRSMLKVLAGGAAVEADIPAQPSHAQ